MNRATNRNPRVNARVVVLPGDGIGPEVIAQAVPVLVRAAERHGCTVTVEEGLLGRVAYDACGNDLPDDTLAAATKADAILVGAVGEVDRRQAWFRGGPSLIRLRKELDLFANLRPVATVAPLADISPLRPEVAASVDMVIVRELSSGIYYGTPRGVHTETSPKSAVNTMTYSEDEVRRVARVAFEAARSRRRELVSVGKHNVLEVSMFWRDVVNEVAADYPDVVLRHEIVDAAAYRLVASPASYDVVLTANLFGDILSDVAAAAGGSLGMAPSASVGDSGPGLFEPVHGSAPDIAGTDSANPIGAILSAAMLADIALGLPEARGDINRAVSTVLADGLRTRDIAAGRARVVGCQEMGSAVLDALGNAGTA
ncbi:MAG: 3-isopropylmalate dehydrogenase [Streptosporangiales bacterium]|nr:3-isopropylmalate dehydrogenase [Streptosporangiales bacterium]